MLTSNQSPGDSFIPTRRRKKNGKGTRRAVSFSDRLQRVTNDIAGTDWMEACQEKMESILNKLGWDPPDVLCLGLGSPTESANAAAQLALVISICDYLKIARDKVAFFDPKFTPEDIDGLLGLEFCVLSENKRGRHALQRRTLLVMPHCGIELYENILYENFGFEELQRILLLGNILEDYAVAIPASKLERESPCIFLIWKHLACEPILSFEPFPCAFNNLGIQYICTDKLTQQDVMWTNSPPIAENLPSAEVF